MISSAIETADHLFRCAADITDESPALSKALWCRRNIKTIEYAKTRSFFKILSGSKVAKSGQNGSCLWDELGELVAEGEEAWQRLYNCGKYRSQPVWFCISTPQYTRNSLWWSQWQKTQKILTNEDTDTEYLAVCHGVPSDVDWREPDNWWPHLDRLGQECVDRNYYLSEYETAKANPRDLARFRNHLLCQPTESIEQWLPLEKIEACISDFTEESLLKKRCFLGIDGALSQLAAITLFFPDTGHIITRLYHPRDTAEKSDNKFGTHFLAYGELGHVKITDGDIFDWDTMKRDIIEFCKIYDVVECAFDPCSLDNRMAELKADLPCVVLPIPQFPSHVSEPTKHIERLVYSGELKIQNNPCLVDCFKNAAVEEKKNEQVILDRNKCSGRYDAVSALICAVNRHIAHMGNSGDADVILL